MDCKKVWKEILIFLEGDLSKAILGTFFEGTELASLEDGKALILCPSRLSLEHLKNRSAEKLAGAIRHVCGQDYFLSFEVRPLPNPGLQELPIFKTTVTQGLVSSYNFSNFVVGLSNQLAVSVAEAVVEQPGSLHNPFFLYSRVGLGKTHLLHAIGNAFQQKNSDSRIVYASAERFTTEFIRGIQSQQTAASFRRKFRGADVLLIDDVQFLAKKEGSQEELFNTFNELFLAGKQIVFASDRHPTEIKDIEQRLISRLAGGMIADVQEPDLDLRLQILRQKAQARGMPVGEEVLLTLAEQAEGSIRQLEGTLNQLLTIATAKQTAPSSELARAILKSVPASHHFVSPPDVIGTVCRCFNVSREQLCSASREREIVRPRQIAAYLLRQMGDVSLNQIGTLLGGKDHTTILHGLRKIEKELTQNNFLHNQVESMRGEILGKTNS